MALAGQVIYLLGAKLLPRAAGSRSARERISRAVAESFDRIATSKPFFLAVTCALAPFGTSGQLGISGSACPSEALRARWQSTTPCSHSAVIPGTARNVTNVGLIHSRGHSTRGG